MRKIKTPPPRKTAEFADVSIRLMPIDLRFRARGKAAHLGISFREFVIQALEEKIASSS